MRVHIGRTAVVTLSVVILVSGCGGTTSEAATYAARLVEEMGLAQTSTSVVEDWFKATQTRTGLTLENIWTKAKNLRPIVVKSPPIRTTAEAFALTNTFLSEHRKLVEDVFVGAMCDTASAIAQGKTVDAASLVTSTIKSSAGTMSETIELVFLQSELEQKVREFALAKTAEDAAGIKSDISFTLECFLLGKIKKS